MSARVVVDGPCPTCSGTGRLLNMSIPGGTPSPCPHCTGGGVTRVVTCAECKHARDYDATRLTYRCDEIPSGMYAVESPEVDESWACASWEGK